MKVRPGTVATGAVALTGAALLLGALSAPALAAGPGPIPTPVTRAATPQLRDHAKASVTRMIVRMRDGGTVSTAVRASGAGSGLTSARELRRTATGARVLQLPEPLTADGAAALARTLSSRSDVAYAAPDTRLFATGAPSPVAPNDPGFGAQWDLWDSAATAPGGFGTKVPAAWSRTSGSADVVVAVLDTGITAHPELDARRVPGYDFVSDPVVGNDGDGRDTDPSDPGDFITVQDNTGLTYGGALTGCADPNDPTASLDSSWHGTHVAGTVVAARDNGIGVSGMAPGVVVEPVRVLGRCGGFISDIADAIVWASGGSVAGVPANAHPASVINLSLGGDGACESGLQDAIDVARGHGATVVVAAGNSTQSFEPDPAYPAAGTSPGTAPADCTGVVDVTATTRAGDLAFYSDWGALPGSLTIAAPGGDGSAGIWSTLNDGLTVPGSPAYAEYIGTSMAAPHVSAAVALLQSMVRPRPAYTPDQVMSVLRGLVQPFPVSAGCDATCGVGILDLSRPLPTYTPTAVTLLVGEAGDGDATLTWSREADGGGLPTQYVVEQGALVPDTYVAIPPDRLTWLSATSVRVAGLTDEQPVTFRVSAQNTLGRSDARFVTLTPTGTWRIPAISAVGGVEQVTVTVTPPPGTPDGYEVMVRALGTVDWRPLGASVGPATTFTVGSTLVAAPDILPAGTYEVRVRAVAGGAVNGFGPWSPVSTATTSALRQTASVSARLFRPFPDGFQDSVTLSVRSNVPTDATVRVYSPSRTPIRVFTLPVATAWNVRWDGRDARGRIAAPGVYHVSVELRGRSSTPVPVLDVPVTVVPSQVGRPSIAASTKVVYPLKDGRLDSATFRVTTNVPAVTTWRILRGTRVVWAKVLTRRSLAIAAWTGRDSHGRRLPMGRYTLVVTAQGGDGRAYSSALALTLVAGRPRR